MNKVETSYLLWALSLFGICGLQRLYNGKIFTGLLWLFTGGLFFVGQLVDLFLIPSMVQEHNDLYQGKLARMNSVGVFAQPTMVVQQVDAPPTRQELMVLLTKSAATHEGKISVTQAVMATGMGFAEAEEILKEMVKTGYVGITNDPETGVVVYDFREI